MIPSSYLILTITYLLIPSPIRVVNRKAKTEFYTCSIAYLLTIWSSYLLYNI
ncbi:hypothetical protein GGR50DRAFT_664813 [Xylaria sp. CBS 124048]|nr:hypothetical protein GGR50DRAFT_664813 [Xylaria sp. CBS 124048]